MIRRPPRSTPLSLHDALPILGYMNRRLSYAVHIDDLYGMVIVALKPRPQMLRVQRFAAKDEIAQRSEEQRLNSSHSSISYAVFCLKKKKKIPNSAQIISYKS